MAVPDGADRVLFENIALNANGGKVFWSRQAEGERESIRWGKRYLAEDADVTTLTADQITVSNNIGATDTVTVAGLSANDKVYLYQFFTIR